MRATIVINFFLYNSLYFLDRSWARRFRGSGKKRPELLNADFGADRERANSPSPLVETKSITTSTAASTPEEESKPK